MRSVSDSIRRADCVRERVADRPAPLYPRPSGPVRPIAAFSDIAFDELVESLHLRARPFDPRQLVLALHTLPRASMFRPALRPKFTKDWRGPSRQRSLQDGIRVLSDGSIAAMNLNEASAADALKRRLVPFVSRSYGRNWPATLCRIIESPEDRGSADITHACRALNCRKSLHGDRRSMRVCYTVW